MYTTPLEKGALDWTGDTAVGLEGEVEAAVVAADRLHRVAVEPSLGALAIEMVMLVGVRCGGRKRGGR